jgi:FtsH-binding integral membrane protein
LGLILASLIFGFSLGIVFTGAMIALACGYILYDTSNVMLHCDETMDVVASIELFASLMTLFYYILHLLLSLNRD